MAPNNPTLRHGLGYIQTQYVDMNTARSPTKNADIKAALDQSRQFMEQYFQQQYGTRFPNLLFWTWRTKCNGNWPSVCWISTGVESPTSCSGTSHPTDDPEVLTGAGVSGSLIYNKYFLSTPIPISKSGPRIVGLTLYINLHWDPVTKDIYVVLLPFVEGWKKIFGSDWINKFQPVRVEIAAKLQRLRQKGFTVGSPGNIHAPSNTAGHLMSQGYIAYKRLPNPLPADHSIMKELFVLMDEYIPLVTAPAPQGTWIEYERAVLIGP